MMEWSQFKSTIPEGMSGSWAVQRYEVTEEAASIHNLRCAINPGRGTRTVEPGTYTRLLRAGHIVMSDTPAEIRDHIPLYIQAKGHVLINGLGLGVAVHLALSKVEVDRVTVIEISKNVISLVGDHLLAQFPDRLEIVWGDAFVWKPPRGIRYGAVWHDIWDNICTDHLSQMATLHRRYGRRCDWQGSWCKELCRMLREWGG